MLLNVLKHNNRAYSGYGYYSYTFITILDAIFKNRYQYSRVNLLNESKYQNSEQFDNLFVLKILNT